MNYPIVINNRNRLTTTKKMVEDLLRLDPDATIIILDNGSTYQPLLDWYQVCKAVVHYLPNYGHLALWVGQYCKYLPEYFIYTDSDIELNPNMPADYQEQMIAAMKRHNVFKCACALSIEDIPDHYFLKTDALQNERGWWQNELEPNIFQAHTDTTFAMWYNTKNHFYDSIRIAGDFTAKHTPWYINMHDLNDEEMFVTMHSETPTQFTTKHKLWLEK